jgi:hypothetical protein
MKGQLALFHLVGIFIMVWLEDPCQMFMTGRIIKAWGLGGDSEAVSCGLVERADINRASRGSIGVGTWHFFAP